MVMNKNLDIPTSGYSVLRGQDVPTSLAIRPAPSKLGTAIKVGLNTFHVEALPGKAVYQFDVMIGSGTEKRGLIKKVWQSKGLKQALGDGFIYDGNKLAWSMRSLDRDIKITVDLDAEEGNTNAKPRKDGKENKHRVAIRQTNRVRIDTLHNYLEGKVAFNNAVLESINFLDHLLREWPALQYTQIKRSFFARGQQRFTLGNAVEAFKGVFASMRIAHGGPKARISINVDVANGMFWTESLLHIAAVALTGRRDVNDLVVTLQKQGEAGPVAKTLRKFRKLHIVANHRRGQRDEYVIERFVYKSAKDEKFEKDGKMTTVYDYFAKEFSVRLQHPDLPLVKMTKGKNTLLPMEVLKIEQNQRYQFKLDDRQTSNMIKFAVEPPPGRWASIQHGLKMLSWDQDPVLKSFGVKINQSMTIADGRLIPAPKVQFGQGEAKPGTSGRWDLSENALYLQSHAYVLTLTQRARNSCLRTPLL
jgi:eukaryotic translation initiation factor 2C